MVRNFKALPPGDCIIVAIFHIIAMQTISWSSPHHCQDPHSFSLSFNLWTVITMNPPKKKIMFAKRWSAKVYKIWSVQIWWDWLRQSRFCRSWQGDKEVANKEHLPECVGPDSVASAEQCTEYTSSQKKCQKKDSTKPSTLHLTMVRNFSTMPEAGLILYPNATWRLFHWRNCWQ